MAADTGPGEAIRVTFIGRDGKCWKIAGRAGDTVMDCAVDNGVPGIAAQCGGGCTCSTCHCYVREPWFGRLGPAVGDEADILAFTPGARHNSRLACQIDLQPALDGLEVDIPEQD